MVKQNKAKVSKSKWVFPLNVIASGIGADSYWSASSLAITIGMAIRRPVGFWVNKPFFLFLCESRSEIERSRDALKTFLSSPAVCWQDDPNCPSQTDKTWLFLCFISPLRIDGCVHAWRTHSAVWNSTNLFVWFIIPKKQQEFQNVL